MKNFHKTPLTFEIIFVSGTIFRYFVCSTNIKFTIFLFFGNDKETIIGVWVINHVF